MHSARAARVTAAAPRDHPMDTPLADPAQGRIGSAVRAIWLRWTARDRWRGPASSAPADHRVASALVPMPSMPDRCENGSAAILGTS